MIKTCKNKWKLGKVQLEMPPLPDDFMKLPGLYSLHTTLDKNVGTEVVLVIYDDTDYIYELKNVNPFSFNVGTLVIKTPYGPVGAFIFYIEDPDVKDKSIAIFEKPVNIANFNHMKPWLELANQTHVHVILVNRKYEVIGFYEFENNYSFENSIDIFMQLKPGKNDDFANALEEYNRTYSLESLYELIKKQKE